MYNFPKMLRFFVTKQTSKFCGTNWQLSRFDDLVKNLCLSYGKDDELSKHITLCIDPRWRAMWHKSVQELVSWVGVTTPDLIVCGMLGRYLMGQGETTMMLDYLKANAFNNRKMLPRTHDKLGWGNFVEGRICKLFLEVVAPTFSRRSRVTPERWGQKLVSFLMQAAHKQ